jgi:acyl-CoA thioesterase I
MWLAQQFANENVFFLGNVMVLAVATWSLFRKQNAVSRIAWLMGIFLVAASSAPLPIWFYVLWGTGLLAFGMANLQSRAGIQRAAACALILLSISAIGMEVPRLTGPGVLIDPRDTIYVIGDSITAGIEGGVKDRERVQTWPTRLRHDHGLDIVDLSQPGAVLSLALKQQQTAIPSGRQDHSAVILEIGGNDVFEDVGADQFRRDLEKLLATIRPKAHTMLMLELPLFPFHNRYGVAQRELAEKYHVPLIPKRRFAAVICANDATLDGLHLSPVGHALMAELVLGLIGSQNAR